MPTRQEVDAQFRERMLTFGYEVRGPERFGYIDLRKWIVATGRLISCGEILIQLDGPDPVLDGIDEQIAITRWGHGHRLDGYYDGQSVYDDSCESCYDEDADEYYECNCPELPDDPEDRDAIERFREQASEIEFALPRWIDQEWRAYTTARQLATDTETTPFGDTIVSVTR